MIRKFLRFVATGTVFLGALLLLGIFAIVFVIVFWDASTTTVVAVLGGGISLVAITAAAAMIGRREWPAASVLLVIAAVSGGALLYMVIPNAERDRKRYGKFLEIEVPPDAHSFSWRSSRSNKYEKNVSFRASEGSLIALGKTPLFGEHEWRELPGGRYRISVKEGNLTAEGRINPENGSFHVTYHYTGW